MQVVEIIRIFKQVEWMAGFCHKKREAQRQVEARGFGGGVRGGGRAGGRIEERGVWR